MSNSIVLDEIKDEDELAFLDFFVKSYQRYDDNIKNSMLNELRNKVMKYNLIQEMIEATSYCHEYGHDYSASITHTYKDYKGNTINEDINYCRRCGKLEKSREQYKVLKKKMSK